MSRTTSPEQQTRNDRVDKIVELFRAGYTVDYACEQGVVGGWTRADVLTVVKQRGWPLDGSGRLPLRMRPRRGPAVPLPQQRLVDAKLPPKLEAVARYDETPGPAVVPEPAAPQATTRPRQPATSPADVSEAVERFLAERTVAAADDQYLTGPELRDAYEAWRSESSAPAVTARWFGVVLSGRYRKKQAVVAINGSKPNCYYGIAWTPAELAAETPTEGTAPGTIGADAAGTAPDSSGSGHGYAGPDAQPQVSPSRSHAGEDGGRGASDAPAAPPVTVTWSPPIGGDAPLAAWERQLLAPGVDPDAWVWDPAAKCYVLPAEQVESGTASDEVEDLRTSMAAAPTDVLALALAHPHPDVRAKAQLVVKAVDAMCSALARHRA